MRLLFSKKKKIVWLSLGILVIVGFFIFSPKIFREHYVFTTPVKGQESLVNKIPEKPVFVPSYVSTPAQVKAIYMTSWVASRNDLRSNLVKMIDETELNTLIIDIKDYSGKIVFSLEENPQLKKFESEEVRVKDLKEFIEMLHKKNIYVIGRIAVFQDEYFVKFRPDLAVKNEAGTAIWKDRKGISWIDAGSREYWDYIIQIAKESRRIGFDEINFDYIRFPSDGNMKDISFPHSSSTPKNIVMKSFFEYLNTNLIFPESSVEEGRLKISADLFGMITTAVDDMGIGQLLEDALPNFDYIMPMVYPSHYPPNFNGYKNPAAFPYEVVKFAMQGAVDRAKLASTSPSKLRPWLQDFDLGANYDSVEVRAQIKATYDVGLDSWALWSASNKYTRGGLENQ